jgi:hypothetical protein
MSETVAGAFATVDVNGITTDGAFENLECGAADTECYLSGLDLFCLFVCYLFTSLLPVQGLSGPRSASFMVSGTYMGHMTYKGHS